jgi:exodeoxyribonuclease-3
VSGKGRKAAPKGNPPAPGTVRLTTWNVNSLRMRLPHLLRFAEECRPDVVCLQELKLAQDQFPEAELRAVFPHLAWWGQPTYNGVAILSKHPLDDVRRGFAGFPDASQREGMPSPPPHPEEARALSATVLGIRLYGLYVVNGQAVGAPKFHHKLAWLGALGKDLDALPPGTPTALLGDFNVAPGDLDVWDPFQCEGQLLCHPLEREALQHVLTPPGGQRVLVDPYRTKQPFANEFSWWDYQKRGFLLNHGLRIDHTFVSEALLPRVRKVTIHRDVRGWDNPSDHAPVSLDLAAG